MSRVTRALAREWRFLEGGVEPTRLLLLFSLLVMVPRYHRFTVGVPMVNQHTVLQIGAPLLLILLVYRENPLDWGLGLGDVRTGVLVTGMFVLLYLPFFLLLIHDESFSAYYMVRNAGGSLDWEAWSLKRLVSLATMVRTEFFFRGFLLFGLRKRMGPNTAILVHLLPYGMAHLGKPELECYGSLLVGYFLGYLSLRTRSVWYGVFLHWFFSSAFQFYFALVGAG